MRLVEKFPNMGKETVTQVQEAQRIQYRINPREEQAKTKIYQTDKI